MVTSPSLTKFRVWNRSSRNHAPILRDAIDVFQKGFVVGVDPIVDGVEDLQHDFGVGVKLLFDVALLLDLDELTFLTPSMVLWMVVVSVMMVVVRLRSHKMV
jgi:hypothetical protein